MALVPVIAAGAEVRVGFTQDALTLDPANHRKRETQTIIRNLYDGLMTQTSKSEVVRQALESYLTASPRSVERSAAVAARKWVGVLKGRADLSVNPAHMKDFGR